uniref:Amino acid transporter n=1 Tax=Strongyloides papillosus TaxID=174720 RepID=A0A0N5CAQ4_STREA
MMPTAKKLIQVNPINLKFYLYILTIVVATIPGFVILGVFKNLLSSMDYESMEILSMLYVVFKNIVTIIVGSLSMIIYCDMIFPITMLGFEYILTKI